MLAYERWLTKAAEGKTSDECWVVPGTPCGQHRTCRFNGAEEYVYRIAWTIKYGVIPENMCVCHRCDNSGCVNLKHLFLGTQSDNIRDMVSKGRGKGVAGVGSNNISARKKSKNHWNIVYREEKSHLAKLTQKQADEIRIRRNAGEKLGILSKEYGVVESVIVAIAKNRRYVNA